MKGIANLNRCLVWLVVLLLCGTAVVHAAPFAAMPISQHSFPVEADVPVHPADSASLFPEIDEMITFSELTRQLPVSKAASHPGVFSQWIEQIDWSRFNSATREPSGAYLYWMDGTLKLSMGNFSDAIVALKKSLDFAGNLKVPFDTLVPKIHNNLALAYNLERNYPKAINHFKNSVQLLENSDNSRSNQKLLVFAFNNLATVYDKMGDYANADRYFKEASRYIDTDTITEANGFFVINLLSFYQNSGKTQAFHDLQVRSEHYFLGHNVTSEEKAFFLNLTGSMYFMEGNYQRAIYFKKQALALGLASGNAALIAEIETQLMHCYMSGGYFDEAIRLGKKVLNSSKEMDGLFKARMSVILAKSLAYIENNDEARGFLDDAQTYLLESNKPSFLKMIIHSLVGQTYMLLDNYKMSENLFHKRLDFLNEHFPDNSIYIANSLFNLGAIHYHQNNMEEAEQFLNESVNLLGQKETFEYHLNNEKISLLSHLYLAKICKARFQVDGLPEHLECGIDHIDKAMAVVDRFRSELEFDQDRITIAGRIEEALDLGMWLSAQNYLQAPGDSTYNRFFTYAQRRKNNSLLEAIKEKNNQIRANLPAGLFNAENATKSKIAALQFQLGQEAEQEKPDEKKISYWQRSLMVAYQNLDSLKAILRSNYPAYYQLKYQSPFISLAEAQKNLNPDQAFLDLFLNDDYLLINLVTTDTVKVLYKKPEPLLMESARRFVKEASRPFNGFVTREEVFATLSDSHALYEALIEPVAREVEGKKLIVVPDNTLASLPFEALVTREPGREMLFHDAPWLVLSNPVSYLYNAALLTAANHKEQYYNRLTAFVPDYHGTAAMHDSVLTGVRQGLNQKLRPIPGATEEVADIARIYRVNKFTGSRASVAQFEKQMEGNNILHLAMHSLISAENPMDSKLVFSPAESDTTGVLEAQTIYNLQTASPLIALSSCNSGSGTSLPGEGIMSLSRAFTFAGAKSTLMTLWAVNDKSASHLVSSFYKKMKDGLSKDVALSDAKREFLKNASPLHAHPYYWANYVITGNQSPLIAQTSVKSKLFGMGSIVLASLILLVAIGFFVRTRRKKHTT